MLRRIADPPPYLHATARALAVYGERAPRRPQEAPHHLDERRLAGAIGTEQADDPAGEHPCHVGDPEHVAVPLAAVLRDDDRLHDEPPTPVFCALRTRQNT